MSEPKPQTVDYYPELTRLPELTRSRRIFRTGFQKFIRFLAGILFKMHVTGAENIPESGPLLIVSNHLGDADLVMGLVVSKKPFDVVAKIELSEIPVVGWLLEQYGVIWIHRGRPDRKALREILNGLNDNRMVAIAPEGRESLTGALEKGTSGAAYIALKAGAPYLPVGFTGTENARVYGNLKRFRRTEITVTVGTTCTIDIHEDRKLAIDAGTDQIMASIAKLLPEEYRGVYKGV